MPRTRSSKKLEPETPDSSESESELLESFYQPPIPVEFSRQVNTMEELNQIVQNSEQRKYEQEGTRLEIAERQAEAWESIAKSLKKIAKSFRQEEPEEKKRKRKY
jgi:hypothetical protein